MILAGEKLDLRLQTPAEVLAWIETLPPEVRVEISPTWTARLLAATGPDPWTCGFEMLERASGAAVGSCAFKGPPDLNGEVEIAYGVNDEHQRKGFATDAARALVAFANSRAEVRTICACTKPGNTASDRVLEKSGFRCVGEIEHPEDGIVNRWVWTPQP